jgi:hypothetical protein
MNDNETALRERYRLAQAAYTDAHHDHTLSCEEYEDARKAYDDANAMYARAQQELAETLAEREAAKYALAELLGGGQA